VVLLVLDLETINAEDQESLGAKAFEEERGIAGNFLLSNSCKYLTFSLSSCQIPCTMPSSM
jgi:hypothetical protein